MFLKLFSQWLRSIRRSTTSLGQPLYLCLRGQTAEELPSIKRCIVGFYNHCTFVSDLLVGHGFLIVGLTAHFALKGSFLH